MALSAFHLLRGFHGTFDVVSYSAVISALDAWPSISTSPEQNGPCLESSLVMLRERSLDIPWYVGTAHGKHALKPFLAPESSLMPEEKGQKWQLAIDMLRHFQRTSGRLDVVIYNATISACEKSTAWWAALHFLAEVCCSHGSSITYKGDKSLSFYVVFSHQLTQLETCVSSRCFISLLDGLTPQANVFYHCHFSRCLL